MRFKTNLFFKLKKKKKSHASSLKDWIPLTGIHMFNQFSSPQYFPVMKLFHPLRGSSFRLPFATFPSLSLNLSAAPSHPLLSTHNELLLVISSLSSSLLLLLVPLSVALRAAIISHIKWSGMDRGEGDVREEQSVCRNRERSPPWCRIMKKAGETFLPPGLPKCAWMLLVLPTPPRALLMCACSDPGCCNSLERHSLKDSLSASVPSLQLSFLLTSLLFSSVSLFKVYCFSK